MKVELSEKQIQTLKWLCGVRHEMHSNRESFFIETDNNYSVFWDNIEANINDRLEEVNLTCIESLKLFYRDDYPTLEYFADGNSLEGIFEDEKDAYYLVIKAVEYFNRSIEIYLQKIDSKYGTSFCPRGVKRARFSQQSKKRYSMHEWNKLYSAA